MHISYTSLYAHTEYGYVFKYLGIYADIHMCICIYIFYMHVWIYMLMYANICAWILPSPLIWIWSPKFFSKTFKFSIYFTEFTNLWSGVNFKKHADPWKENPISWKSCKHSEPARAISKIEERREFSGDGDMNNARRILQKDYTLSRGCCFWSKKPHVQKNCDANFIVA